LMGVKPRLNDRPDENFFAAALAFAAAL